MKSPVYSQETHSRRRRRVEVEGKKWEKNTTWILSLALTLRFFSSESIQISEAEDAAAKKKEKKNKNRFFQVNNIVSFSPLSCCLSIPELITMITKFLCAMFSLLFLFELQNILRFVGNIFSLFCNDNDYRFTLFFFLFTLEKRKLRQSII